MTTFPTLANYNINIIKWRSLHIMDLHFIRQRMGVQFLLYIQELFLFCILRLIFTSNFLHLYSTFLDTQSALHSKGESPHPSPVCSIHLDDATVALVHQNIHHTPAYWRRQSDEANQCMGWLGGHDGQRPMGKFGQDAEVTPPLFFEGHPGIFLMTTESQDLGLTSHLKDDAFYSIVSPSLLWGVRTHTDHRVSTPCWSH